MVSRVPATVKIKNAFVTGDGTTGPSTGAGSHIPVTYPIDMGGIFGLASLLDEYVPFIFPVPLFPHANSAVRFYGFIRCEDGPTTVTSWLYIIPSFGSLGLLSAPGDPIASEFQLGTGARDVEDNNLYMFDIRCPIAGRISSPLEPLILLLYMGNSSTTSAVGIGHPVMSLGSATDIGTTGYSMNVTALGSEFLL